MKGKYSGGKKHGKNCCCRWLLVVLLLLLVIVTESVKVLSLGVLRVEACLSCPKKQYSSATHPLSSSSWSWSSAHRSHSQSPSVFLSHFLSLAPSVYLATSLSFPSSFFPLNA